MAGGFVVLPAAFPFYDASRLSRSNLPLFANGGSRGLSVLLFSDV